MTSIEDSNEYKTYMSKLIRNSFDKYLEFSSKYRHYLNRNSKQIISTTRVNYYINLTYMTKDYYLNQKQDNIPKKRNQSLDTYTINEL